MRPSRRSHAVFLFAVLALALAAGVANAGQDQRPVRQLFGPGARDADAGFKIDLLVDGYEGRGQNQTGTVDGVDQAVVQQSRFYTGVFGTTSYERQGRRASLRLFTGHSARYFDGLGAVTQEHHGGIGFAAQTGRRTRVRGEASALYTPYHQLLAVPELEGQSSVAPVVEGGISVSEALIYNATFGIDRQFGKNTELAFDAGARIARYGAADRDTNAGHLGAIFSRQLTRGIALNLGDTVRVLEGANHQRIVAHDITAGLDYDRSLAFSRRTRLAFNSGAAITSDDEGQQYGVIGMAQLTHEMGRTWSIASSFDRNLRVVDLLPEPFFANSMSLYLGGTVGRRVSFRTRGAYAFGAVTLQQSDSSRYSSVIGETRVAIALGRHFQIYLEHLYYEHRFPMELALPAGLSHRRIQNGGRIGLNLWAPLVRAIR
jgi:hypothetical protein